jgi:cell wall-associated NlpC family hydrolase
MTSMLPGDFYLTRIGGATGVFITLSQWAIGDLSRYSHAGIYLGEVGGTPMVAEAMPGGLQINPLSKYDGKELVHSRFELTSEQRAHIVALSLAKEGTPYSYLGYLYVGLSAFKRCPKWVKDQVSSADALFCSQFVDFVYNQAGVELFDDGRIYLDVTPGDLARLLAEG